MSGSNAPLAGPAAPINLGGAFNTDIFKNAGAGTAPPNPLDQLGKISSIQLQQNQNAQFQQQFAARKAMGPILQASVGKDGAIDWDKVVINMAAHPETAFMAGDVAKDALQRKLTTQEILSKSLDNAGKQYNSIGGMAQALAPLGAKVTRGDVLDKLVMLSSGPNPAIEPAKAMEFATHLKGDGVELQQQLQGLSYMVQQAGPAFDRINGVIQTTNTGGQTQVNRVTAAPGMRPVTPLGSMGNTPSPDTFYHPQETPDLSVPGGTKLIPQGPKLGMPAPGADGNNFTPADGSNGGELAPPSPVDTGAGAGGGVPAPGTVAPPPRQPGVSIIPSQPKEAEGIPYKLNPAYQSYQAGDSSNPVVQYERALNNRVQEGQTMLTQWNKTRELLKQVRSGGGAEVRTQLAKIAQAVNAPQNILDAIQGGGQGAYDAALELQKLQTRMAMTTLGSDVGNHDQQAASTFNTYRNMGSPNMGMSDTAQQNMADFMQKLVERQMLEQKAFNIYKGRTVNGKYEPNPNFMANPQGWQAKWNDILQHSNQDKMIMDAANKAFK